MIPEKLVHGGTLNICLRKQNFTCFKDMCPLKFITPDNNKNNSDSDIKNQDKY